MTNNIYTIFKEELDQIIHNSNTIAIFLVGSSKDIDFEFIDGDINDIDIFVFTNIGDKQERIIKKVNQIEFDINYFSMAGVKDLIDNKEYFFLKEMKDARIIYDKNNMANPIINSCKKKYLEGPQKISIEEKKIIKLEIESKISRLGRKENFDKLEYEFLTKIYLKDIILGYFKIKDNWIPKDKKLLKNLKIENIKLFNLIEVAIKEGSYKSLLDAYNYAFEDVTIDDEIKISY